MAGIGEYKGEGSFSMNSPLDAGANGGYTPFKMRGSPMQRNYGIGMQTLTGDSPAKLAWFIPLIAKAAAGAAKVGAVIAKGAAVAGKAVAGVAKGAAGLAKGAAKGIGKAASKAFSKSGIKGAVQKQTGKFASKISGGKVQKASQLFTKEGIKGVAKTQTKQIPGKVMESMEKTSQKQSEESQQAREIGAQAGQQFGEMKMTTGGSEEKDDPTTPFAMKGFSGFGNSPLAAVLPELGSRGVGAEMLRTEASKKSSLLRPPGMQWLMGKDKATSGYGQKR